MQGLWYLCAFVLVLSIVLILDYILHRKYREMKEEFDSEAEGLEKEHLRSEIPLEDQKKEINLERIDETNKKRILIVDDDDILAPLMKIILQGEGFETEIAKDGIEGLEKVKHDEYHVIISDCEMPRMKGDKFYLEVQKLSQDLAKRIIFISGNINDFIMSTGNRFLSKPFSNQQLVETVKNLIASNK